METIKINKDAKKIINRIKKTLHYSDSTAILTLDQFIRFKTKMKS